MAETTDNLILEHLKALRADNAEVKSALRDIKGRLASIESYIATLHGDQARVGVTIDELAARIERLEVRPGISAARNSRGNALPLLRLPLVQSLVAVEHEKPAGYAN